MIVKYTEKEKELLARLMRAEAVGEGNLGMLMVGNVGINRVLADCLTFKDIRSISEMVYQSPGGFSGTSSSLFYGNPTALESSLAERVIRGEYYYPATNALWFYAPPEGTSMLNLLKGFIIGIGKIIPGVSGSVLAITLGVYDKSVEYINNFKHNKKESLKYLLPLGIGIIISIIIFSKIITILLDKYYQITMLFFIGLIIGGLPEIIKKVKKQDNIIVGTSFIIFFIISISNLNSNYILKGNILDIIILFISGLLEAIGTVVPGVSSSALLMILGTYNIILSSIGNITSISVILTNIKIIIPFLLGVFLGIITLIKIIDYLLKKHENKLYSFVLGVLLSSIILLIIKVFKEKITIVELIFGIIFLLLGVLISNLIKK